MGNCKKCGKDFEATDPPTLYCPECAPTFKEEQRGATQRMRGGGHFADGAPLSPKDCPATFLTGGREACGVCGGDDLTPEYGHTVYGLGTHKVCETCKVTLDFVPDKGG